MISWASILWQGNLKWSCTDWPARSDLYNNQCAVGLVMGQGEIFHKRSRLVKLLEFSRVAFLIDWRSYYNHSTTNSSSHEWQFFQKILIMPNPYFFKRVEKRVLLGAFCLFLTLILPVILPLAHKDSSEGALANKKNCHQCF